MNKRLFLLILMIVLTACGPSSEELAFQTREAATALAASWTETPTLTPTSTSTPTPEPTATSTLAPSQTSTNTYTPTITPYPVLNIADEPEYPTGVSSDDPWSVLMFIVDTVDVIQIECALLRIQHMVSPFPESCPYDDYDQTIGIKLSRIDYFKNKFCVYGQLTDVYYVDYEDTTFVKMLGQQPTLYTLYDRRYTYQEYQELVLLQDCREIIADWEATQDD